MIVRHWKGIPKLDDVGNDADHLIQQTFPGLERINGFGRASVLNRSLDHGVAFLIATEWPSVGSIRQFSGDHDEAAVVRTVVRRMMLPCDECAQH